MRSSPDACLELGRIAKQESPGATYILSGVHPTFMWKDVLEAPGSPVDFIVMGEGDETTEALLRVLQNGADVAAIPGLAYRREDGQAMANAPRTFMCDLEKYPADFGVVDDWSTYRYFVIPDSRLGAVSASRGCSFTCTFCSQQKFWNRSWRRREPERVVEEIRRLNVDKGVNVFLLTDEYPTQDAARWEEFLDRLIAFEARHLPAGRDAGARHRARVLVGL